MGALASNQPDGDPLHGRCLCISGLKSQNREQERRSAHPPPRSRGSDHAHSSKCRANARPGFLLPELVIEMFRRMLLIREFDSRHPDLYAEGLVRGSSHASIGQEAVAVGACLAQDPADFMTSAKRGHGHTIAKGGDANDMMAELLGRATGYGRGKRGACTSRISLLVCPRQTGSSELESASRPGQLFRHPCEKVNR